MKSPHNKISKHDLQRKLYQKQLQHTNQQPIPHSLFQQQSPSYRSKSIDKKVSDLNNKIIVSAVKQKNYRSAISLLHQLENHIFNQNNQSCRTNKLLFYHQLSICYYNHAVVYQRVSNDQQTSVYFQKSLKNLQYMQGYITTRQQGVSYSVQLAKLQLQFCSILSQVGKHQQAISYAQKSLQKLIECFRVLQAICFEYITTNRLPQTNSNSRQSRTKIQHVNFKKHVLIQAQKMLKQMSLFPQPHEITTKFKQKYDKLMQKNFFWKDNQQNNEKQLRKQFQNLRRQMSSDRNILGVQKNSFFNQNLKLQTLTNLQIKSIEYNYQIDPFYLLSSPKLTEMAFYASMIYFTLATQIRLSQVDLNVNKLKIDEKYKKLNRDERMIKCKMIHMKAIQIAGMFLPQKCQYFSHILTRYNKNYRCILEEINQDSKEQSMKDLQSQTQLKFNAHKQRQPQQEYGLRNSERFDGLDTSLHNLQNQSINHVLTNSVPIKHGFKKNNKKDEVIKSQVQKQNKRKLSSNKQKQNIGQFQQQHHKRSKSKHQRNRSNSISCKEQLKTQRQKQRQRTLSSSVQHKQMSNSTNRLKIRQLVMSPKFFSNQNNKNGIIKQRSLSNNKMLSPVMKRKVSKTKLLSLNQQNKSKCLKEENKCLYLKQQKPCKQNSKGIVNRIQKKVVKCNNKV